MCWLCISTSWILVDWSMIIWLWVNRMMGLMMDWMMRIMMNCVMRIMVNWMMSFMMNCVVRIMRMMWSMM